MNYECYHYCVIPDKPSMIWKTRENQFEHSCATSFAHSSSFLLSTNLLLFSLMLISWNYLMGLWVNQRVFVITFAKKSMYVIITLLNKEFFLHNWNYFLLDRSMIWKLPYEWNEHSMIFNWHSLQNYICTYGTFNDVIKYCLTYSEMQKFLVSASYLSKAIHDHHFVAALYVLRR